MVADAFMHFLVDRQGEAANCGGLASCRPWAAQLTDYAPQRTARSASYKLFEVTPTEFVAFADDGIRQRATNLAYAFSCGFFYLSGSRRTEIHKTSRGLKPPFCAA
jgi:hypothetical protein